MAIPAQAQSTTTATVVGPTSLHEGGLVAQQVGDCPEKPGQRPTKRGGETVSQFYTRYIAWYRSSANEYDWGYCEFRDDGDESFPTHRYTELSVTFHNFEAGVQYKAQLMPSSRLEFARTASREITFFTPTTADARYTRPVMLRGKANFTEDGNATETINILGRGGAVIGSYTITIIDDDDMAYIGQRRHHPYGASWKSQPHCYTHNCAWD